MHYTFHNLPEIYDQIKQSNTKLIYVAGASASGKSFFAKKLKKFLEDQVKRVFSVSSDMYYTNDSGTKFVLYGTFDHPNLISYHELGKDIHQYLETGKTKVPEYSFTEKRRIAEHPVTEEYDYLIVEGLYTISQLPKRDNPFKIFVHADAEELIFRRLIRDQERTQDPLHASITITSKVFPMWTLYGATQEENADAVVYNDYEIMAEKGTSSHTEQLPSNIKKSDLGTLEKRFYVTDFIYNDSNDDNGKVFISEHYKKKSGLLDHVAIVKSKKISSTESKKIVMKLYEPGILTGLHTLLQLAGLHYEGSQKIILSTYTKNGETQKILHRKGVLHRVKKG